MTRTHHSQALITENYMRQDVINRKTCLTHLLKQLPSKELNIRENCIIKGLSVTKNPFKSGRGGEIRTRGLLNPIQTRYRHIYLII